MKKLILAILTCAFIASPAFANVFKEEQTNMLNNITMQMERFKEDAKKMDFLTQKRTCVEEATELSGLQECMSKFNPVQLESMTN